jgi:hypothetical protein
MTDLIPSHRCCPSHADWPQLTRHLIESFPDVPLVEIVGVVNRTRRAQSQFGPPDSEQLRTAEIIVRHQLMQLTGRETSAVRLDP